MLTKAEWHSQTFNPVATPHTTDVTVVNDKDSIIDTNCLRQH